MTHLVFKISPSSMGRRLNTVSELRQFFDSTSVSFCRYQRLSDLFYVKPEHNLSISLPFLNYSFVISFHIYFKSTPYFSVFSIMISSIWHHHGITLTPSLECSSQKNHEPTPTLNLPQANPLYYTLLLLYIHCTVLYMYCNNTSKVLQGHIQYNGWLLSR